MKPSTHETDRDGARCDGTARSSLSGVSDGPAEGGALKRWSRRKRAAVVSGIADEPAPVAQSQHLEPVPVPPEAGTTELLLSDDDMPDLATLDGSSDISPFFNRGVSAALKKAALRRIFSLPKYNVRDGLDDYDGDYTRFEPLGDTVTCDMRFHAVRHERTQLLAEVDSDLRADSLAGGDMAQPASLAETESVTADESSGTQSDSLETGTARGSACTPEGDSPAVSPGCPSAGQPEREPGSQWECQTEPEPEGVVDADATADKWQPGDRERS